MTETEGTPLSRRLVADREATGMSQRVVSSKLVTTTQNISGWENGHYRPGPKYLAALAELYGQDPGEYLALLNASPASGKAKERARRLREKAKAEARAAKDRAEAQNVRGATRKLKQRPEEAPQKGSRRRRRQGPPT